jgi:hypothetical protein
MNRRNHDVEKQRYWQKTIGDAARSGMSIREFCRQRRVKESQFYWWRPASAGSPAWGDVCGIMICIRPTGTSVDYFRPDLPVFKTIPEDNLRYLPTR